MTDEQRIEAAAAEIFPPPQDESGFDYHVQARLRCKKILRKHFPPVDDKGLAKKYRKLVEIARVLDSTACQVHDCKEGNLCPYYEQPNVAKCQAFIARKALADIDKLAEAALAEEKP